MKRKEVIVMNKFLNSIVFRNITKKKELKKIIEDVIQHADEKRFVARDDDTVFVEYRKLYSERMGVCVCGEYDEDNHFLYDYYYPFLIGRGVTSREDIVVERHAAKESYAGVCDDLKVGVSLIFYLQNRITYLKMKYTNQIPVKGTTLTINALALNGTIMMPINKNEQQKKRSKKASIDRNHLIEQARMGDEDAIESLTLEDMDTYTVISKKIHKEDVFSLVDTYFMPYGVECDQYSILGEILEVQNCKNQTTEEEIILLTIDCNEIVFYLCINKEDLYGEPQVGRRFKGVVWLQGYINFPEEIV